VLPIGPGGEDVTDSFTFVHQPLAGDGSITVRVTALTAVPRRSRVLAAKAVVAAAVVAVASLEGPRRPGAVGVRRATGRQRGPQPPRRLNGASKAFLDPPATAHHPTDGHRHRTLHRDRLASQSGTREVNASNLTKPDRCLRAVAEGFGASLLAYGDTIRTWSSSVRSERSMMPRQLPQL
jgi:hypothetical protein